MICKQYIFILVTFLILVVGGSAKGAEQPVFRLGTLGHSLGFLQVDIASAKGWLTTGNVRTQIVYFKSGKECATALLSGNLDAAVLGVDHAITGQLKGIPIKQTALLNRLPGWTFVASNRLCDQVSTPADLKGMRVGVTSPGSATHILSTYLLSKYGITAKDFTVVKSGSATMPDIMRHNGIDAGMAMEPYGSSLLASKDAFLLVDLRDAEETRKHLGALYPLTALLIHDEFMQAHREAAQDVTAAIVWACKWLKDATADDVINLLPREFIPNPIVWKASFEASRDVFPADGRNDLEGIRAVVDAQVVFGKLKSPDQVKIEALYDESFWTVANALQMPDDVVPTEDATNPPGLDSAKQILLLACFVALVVAGIFLLRKRSRS